MKLLKRLAPFLIALTMVLCFASPAAAATSADITITATPEYLAITISNSPNTWAIGAIAESTTAWWTADGNAPNPEPFEDADMKETLTNAGSIASNISIHGHDFTGGVGWTLSEDDTPAADEVSIRAGITGTANAAAMIQVIHEDTELVHSLAASGTKKMCMSAKTGTFTDGAAKSSTVTLTITKHV